jgi:4-amino-4-deoxy-L-arabinose transferase-like glycosyltransferase
MTQPSGTPPPACSPIFQRHWTWWFMVAVLGLVAAVRLRLLNFPLERDEGEYAYSGQLMLQGIPPYELAYNMKFPGTYAAYALVMKLFGQTPAGIHFGVLCMTTLTALMLFWLGKKILDETAGVVSAIFYAVLAASPSMLGLAGHATHFAAFFTTAGLCVLWRARQNGNWLAAFASGLLFGTAILMKQHAALIGAWAGIAFAVTRLRRRETPVRERFLSVAACGAGMILPFALCCLILWHAEVFGKFWFWTIDYARQYASAVPLDQAPRLFWRSFSFVAAKTFPLWIIAASGLGLIWFDGRLRQVRSWLLGFSLASALALCPDFYFRKHYYLLALPAVALLAGCAVSTARQLWGWEKKASSLGDWPVWGCAVMVAATILINGKIWFILTPEQAARTIYGPDPFAEAGVVAGFVRENSAPDSRLAVIGSDPEIYFLAQRRSATGYIYTYGLMEPQPFARQMQGEMIREIETGAPQFVVYADNTLSWGREPDSDPKIFDWWKSYQTNFTLVGIADVISSTETIYALTPELAARYGGKVHGLGFEIYRRK